MVKRIKIKKIIKEMVKKLILMLLHINYKTKKRKEEKKQLY